MSLFMDIAIRIGKTSRLEIGIDKVESFMLGLFHHQADG